MKKIIYTSNKDKIEEFKSILGNDIEVQKGPNLREIDANPFRIAEDKALQLGKGSIAEDTVLEVDGEVDVKIKEAIQKYKGKDCPAKWIVTLGLNTGVEIKLYRGVIEGVLKPIDEIPEDSFGFDAYFVPKDLIDPHVDDTNYPIAGLTLYELKKAGLKNVFSARREALTNLMNDNPCMEPRMIKNIPKWEGEYQ